jgi:DNA transposition AAA+ family ATPase
MSSTRKVKDGARRMQNGWASAPEFEELRGLNGSAVMLKAELFDDPKTKTLLYFLQGVSLLPGGLRRIAGELLEMFPERLGTATMIKIGCKAGKRLTQKERDEIDMELNSEDVVLESLAASLAEERIEPPHCQKNADDFLKECRWKAESHLETFLERICCDPEIAILSGGQEEERYRTIAELVLQDSSQLDFGKRLYVEDANVKYFHDLPGALHEYKRRYEERRREMFIKTSIGKVVFEALDYALETGRSALIEGNSGIGKTTGLEAWCAMHAGESRLVKLKGITHRTGFFREVARACGLARGTGLSPGKIQMRVEQFLQRSKLMLVIDEGQYLFPPGNRVYTPPELINWLMTACYNEHVPFAISATAEFRKRRAIIEKNTTWQSEQLRRRLRRDFELPQKPTEEDLLLVAEKLLPGQSRSAVELVAGYSMTSGGYFQAITDTIDDARLMARRDGRDKFTFADLRAAIQEWRSPSDNALQRVFEETPKARRAGRPSLVESEPSAQTAEPINDRLKASCGPLKAIPRHEISLVPN